MSVRRRQVLAVATASLALAVVGCSPMAMARKRRKWKVQQYLSGLDAVASARVEVHPEFVEPDRWIVDVRLKDDPSAESVATVVRDAYAEVLRLTGDGEARMVVTWVKGKTSVFCYLPMKDADKAPPSRWRRCLPAWSESRSRRREYPSSIGLLILCRILSSCRPLPRCCTSAHSRSSRAFWLGGRTASSLTPRTRTSHPYRSNALWTPFPPTRDMGRS